jgi:GT2 family glycosyltransferase
MTRPSLSVVVPTHNTRELTLRCLSSLADGGVAPVDVIVVDDDSSDGTAEAVRALDPDIELLSTDTNVGFTKAANLGVARTRGDVILLLNSDTEVLEGALAALVAAFTDDPTLGIGGAELFDPNGAAQWRAGGRPTGVWLFVQASGLGATLSRLPGRRLLGAPGAGRTGAVDWVAGTAMAVRREVWESCGPFDEGFRFYCQDLDLCTRAGAAGSVVAVVNGFRVLHHHGATISRRSGASGSFHPALMWTDLLRFVKKDRGARAARRAASAIRAGARLRLIGLALRAPFATGVGSDEIRRQRRAYREGLEALSMARR